MESINVNFCFEGDTKIIKGKKDEYLDDILKSYADKIHRNINNIYCLYNGNIINEKITLGQISNEEKEIKLLVFEYQNEDEDEESNKTLKKSKYIICPICKEICLFNFDNYKINFYNCKNKDCFSKVLFEEFNNFQSIDESKILCNNCGKKKSEI